MTDADDFPHPRSNQRDSDDCKANKCSSLSLPCSFGQHSSSGNTISLLLTFFVIKDCLESPSSWDLDDDGEEGQQTPGPEIVVICVDGATIDQETFCWKESRDLVDLSALEQVGNGFLL